MSIEVTVEYAHREWNYYDNVVHIRNYQQLQAKVAELEAEVERLSAAHVKACQANADSQAELAKAEQQAKELSDSVAQKVAEACALQVATETRFHWLDAARVAKEIRSGEWRKFVKEV